MLKIVTYVVEKGPSKDHQRSNFVMACVRNQKIKQTHTAHRGK